MHPAIIKNMYDYDDFSIPIAGRSKVKAIFDYFKILACVIALYIVYTAAVDVFSMFGYKSKDTLKAENVALVEKVEQVVKVNHENVQTQEVKQEAVVKADAVFVEKEKTSKEVQKKIEKVKDTFTYKAEEVKAKPDLTFEQKEEQLSSELIDALWAGHELMKGTPQ